MITIHGLNSTTGETEISLQVPAAQESQAVAEIEAKGLLVWICWK